MGRNVLRELVKHHPDYYITALVRPGTAPARYAEFAGSLSLAATDALENNKPAPQFGHGITAPVRIVEIDLADLTGLKDFLFINDFDTILHIGALRGGRRFSKSCYSRSNIQSTEQMVEYCLAKKARLIFCSSVGVFGAIPSELPASYQTEKNPDNYYHYTKIEAEQIINKAILYGLQAAIVRPSITYGKGDKGFPLQLVKMVKYHIFPLINKRTWIHLCNIGALVQAFMWLVDKPWKSGLTLTVADREPVELKSLVDFISRQVHGKSYPKRLTFDRFIFTWGERIARFLHNELWISRFELISKSWFYDVSQFYTLMEQEGNILHFTIPEFKITVEDYLKK